MNAKDQDYNECVGAMSLVVHARLGSQGVLIMGTG